MRLQPQKQRGGGGGLDHDNCLCGVVSGGVRIMHRACVWHAVRDATCSRSLCRPTAPKTWHQQSRKWHSLCGGPYPCVFLAERGKVGELCKQFSRSGQGLTFAHCTFPTGDRNTERRHHTDLRVHECGAFMLITYTLHSHTFESMCGPGIHCNPNTLN